MLLSKSWRRSYNIGKQQANYNIASTLGFRTTGMLTEAEKPRFQIGSFVTFMPSVEYGGTLGKLNYYAITSYYHSGIGIENPTIILTSPKGLATFLYLR